MRHKWENIMNQMVQADVFEQVLLSHAEMCYSVALALTGNPEGAQNLAREILTEAWHLRDSAHGRKELKKRLLLGLREKFLKDRSEARAVLEDEALAGVGMMRTLR
jgi:DNA-directed RNA polymerase specialized sigma24 family protein